MVPFAEETFGPVVSIYGYTDVTEAIDRANDTPFGLNASVWSRNGRAGWEVAARLKAGTVNVNEGYAATFGSVGVPMGGMKDSGVGRRNGAEGLLKYTESQSIALQRGLALRPPKRVPGSLWSRGHDAGPQGPPPPPPLTQPVTRVIRAGSRVIEAVTALIT